MKIQTEELYQRLVLQQMANWRKATREKRQGVYNALSIWSLICTASCISLFSIICASIISLMLRANLYHLSILFFGSMALLIPTLFLSAKKMIQKADKEFPIPPGDILPSKLIPSYLLERLTSLQEELIGDRSRFGKALANVQAINRRARANAESIQARLARRPGAAHLQALADTTQKIIFRASCTEQRLLEFRAKVEAYLTECKEAIGQVEEPLVDLELVRSTNELAAQIVVVEKEAWGAVDEVVDSLGHMTGTLQKEVEERFGESGVLVASELEIANPLRYLEVVEGTIITFDPVKVRQRVAAMR